MKVETDRYLDLQAAQDVLTEMGVIMNARQIRRAAEPDAKGNRRLPFFKDPITGRLRIAESRLRGIYQSAQRQAETKDLHQRQ